MTIYPQYTTYIRKTFKYCLAVFKKKYIKMKIINQFMKISLYKKTLSKLPSTKPFFINAD